MIPYVEVPSLPVYGPLVIHPFGVLVVIGVAVGWRFIRAHAAEYGIGQKEIQQAMTWAVVVGFAGAHLVELFFYQPYRLEKYGILAVFMFGFGLSSYGGFFGAALGLAVWVRRHHKSWLQYGDLLVQGLVLGWIFGRTGCFLVHDHPGAKTDFFLGVAYPDGTRHDLGLYELLFTVLVLVPVMLWMNRRPWPRGTYLVTFMLLYAPVRFALDFLRATDRNAADPRMLGLTLGHYSSLAVLALAAALLTSMRRSAAHETRPRAA